MERRILHPTEDSGFWEYAFGHEEHSYVQWINRDHEGRYSNFIGRVIGEWMDATSPGTLELLWDFKDGYYTSLDKAIDAGNQVIELDAGRKLKA